MRRILLYILIVYFTYHMVTQVILMDLAIEYSSYFVIVLAISVLYVYEPYIRTDSNWANKFINRQLWSVTKFLLKNFNNKISLLIGLDDIGKKSLLRQNYKCLEPDNKNLSLSWWYKDSHLVCLAAPRINNNQSVRYSLILWQALFRKLRWIRLSFKVFDELMIVMHIGALHFAHEPDQARDAEQIKITLKKIFACQKNLPCRLLLNQADLIAGFRETFAQLNESSSNASWYIQNSPSYNDSYDKLIDDLNSQVVKRLHQEPSIKRRILIKEFPLQLEQLRQPILNLLKQFDLNNKNQLAFVHFCSVKQVGMPFDYLEHNDISKVRVLHRAQSLLFSGDLFGEKFLSNKFNYWRYFCLFGILAVCSIFYSKSDENVWEAILYKESSFNVKQAKYIIGQVIPKHCNNELCVTAKNNAYLQAYADYWYRVLKDSKSNINIDAFAKNILFLSKYHNPASIKLVKAWQSYMHIESMQQRIESIVAYFNRSFVDKFPFKLDAKKDVKLKEFINLFKPNGVLDSFVKQYLSQYATFQENMWQNNGRYNFSEEFLNHMTIAHWITRVLFAESAQPHLQFSLVPVKFPRNVKKVILDIDNQHIEMHTGTESAINFTWPFMLNQAISIDLVDKANLHHMLSVSGPFAVFRLLQKAILDNKSVLHFNIHGQQLACRLILKDQATYIIIKEFIGIV